MNSQLVDVHGNVLHGALFLRQVRLTLTEISFLAVPFRALGKGERIRGIDIPTFNGIDHVTTKIDPPSKSGPT